MYPALPGSLPRDLTYTHFPSELDAVGRWLGVVVETDGHGAESVTLLRSITVGPDYIVAGVDFGVVPCPHAALEYKAQVLTAHIVEILVRITVVAAGSDVPSVALETGFQNTKINIGIGLDAERRVDLPGQFAARAGDDP